MGEYGPSADVGASSSLWYLLAAETSSPDFEAAVPGFRGWPQCRICPQEVAVSGGRGGVRSGCLEPEKEGERGARDSCSDSP